MQLVGHLYIHTFARKNENKKYSELCYIMLCDINQQMHKLMFEVNAWFLRHVSKSVCSSIGRPFVHAVLYRMLFIHLYKQSSRWKEVLNTNCRMLDCWHKCKKNAPYKTACTNVLPDDEHMMFDTCRRSQELI